MTYRKPLALFAAVAAVCGFAVPAAVAGVDEPAPECPGSSEALDTYTPSFLRVGKSFKVEVETTDSDVDVSAVTVTVGSRVLPMTLDDDGTAAAILSGPSHRGRVEVVFRWEQDPGTNTACQGTDGYSLLAIPVRAKAGDPDKGRLSGVYSVREKRHGHVIHVRWTFKPQCDFFGCTSHVRSTGGANGLFRPRGSHYRYARAEGGSGYCKLTYVDGSTKVIKPATHLTTAFEIKATRARIDGVITRFRGTEVDTYTPTTRAMDAGCGTADTIRRYSVTGVRH